MHRCCSRAEKVSPSHFSPYNWRLSKIFGIFDFWEIFLFNKRKCFFTNMSKTDCSRKRSNKFAYKIPRQVNGPVKTAHLFNQAQSPSHWATSPVSGEASSYQALQVGATYPLKMEITPQAARRRYVECLVLFANHHWGFRKWCTDQKCVTVANWKAINIVLQGLTVHNNLLVWNIWDIWPRSPTAKQSRCYIS